MTRFLMFAWSCLVCVASYGQARGRSLHDYVATAIQNSPLIKDYHNQTAITQAELQRLKALYTRSRMELNGDYLFVPVIDTDGSSPSFQWNAQNGTDYYGYDLGESSGHLHSGITWTKPLLGKPSYKLAEEQAKINTDMAKNHIRMEKHQLERTVAEQYMLCVLDRSNIDFTDSIAIILDHQTTIIRRLLKNGLAKQSDLNLLSAQREANAEQRTSAIQSYQSHLMDLNLCCGIEDTSIVTISDTCIAMSLPPQYRSSLFTEQFRLDSLNNETDMKSFNLQYRPHLDFFVNGGLQIGNFKGWYRHFGMSAGLTFAWTLYDGKQRRWKEQQVALQQATVQSYKENADYQRRMRIAQTLAEMKKYDERKAILQRQQREYDVVLSNYEKEIHNGQVSVLDYITVLINKIQTERNLMLLNTNRQLAVVAYNYWNW